MAMGQAESALLAPDNLPGDSFQDQASEVSEYAQEAMNRVAAQYRFAGLVAGIKGPNDTDEDVEAAREAVINAVKDFLNPESGPLSQQVDQLHWELVKERDNLNREMFGIGDSSVISGIYPRGHPADLPESMHEFNATGGKRQWLEDSMSRRSYDEATKNRLREMLAKSEQLSSLEDQRREQVREGWRQYFRGIWQKAKDYYNDKIALIKEGKYLVAAGKIVVDGLEVFHADIAIAIISAAVIAVTGAVTAVMAPIIVSAVAHAVRVVKAGAGVLRRAQDEMRHAAAATVFSVRLHIVEPNVQNIPSARPNYFYERQVDVSRDLTEDERFLLNEENQGSTSATDDAGDSANKQNSTRNMRDEDFDAISDRVGAENIRLAGMDGASPAQVNARSELVKAFESHFGISPGGTNILDADGGSGGMDLERPMRIVKYPPPDRLVTWRNEKNIGEDGKDVRGFGNFFDPSGGRSSPNELGINSVGRTEGVLDVSEKPGIAFQGHGAPIPDNWSVNGAGVRYTEGGPPQWYIPDKDYKPTPDDLVENRNNWRDLPGNRLWVEAEKEGRLTFEQREGDNYPKWYLDGDQIPETGGVR